MKVILLLIKEDNSIDACIKHLQSIGVKILDKFTKYRKILVVDYSNLSLVQNLDYVQTIEISNRLQV
jgi:hypothetical protein